jgi:hypothetical protein
MKLALAFLLAVSPARAEVLIGMDEALALAFPGCDVRQRTHYLTHQQRSEAGERAATTISSGLVREYRGLCEGELVGSAYFDTHPIRELPATLMVVVTPGGEVARMELLSFDGPEPHRPPQSFYAAFHGMTLGRELTLRRAALRPVSGATLSSRAAVEAARRVLALHAVIQQEP